MRLPEPSPRDAISAIRPVSLQELRVVGRVGRGIEDIAVGPLVANVGRMSDTEPRQLMIVPVDFSRPSLNALHWAFEYAKTTPTVVHILHVVERTLSVNDLMSPDIEGLRSELDNVKLSVEDQLKSVAPDTATREQIGEVHSHVMIGRPADEICGFAEQLDADLIVMGTHGHTGMKRILLGSVAERVVREGPCTVVSVKGKEAS